MDFRDGALLANTGAMIAEIRRERGISQEELANLCRVHRNTIGKLERGEVDPSLTAINRIFVKMRVGGVSFNTDGVIPFGGLDERLAKIYGEISPVQSLARIAFCVRTLRKHHGFSLCSLARAANIHINTVWGFENRTVDPSLMTTYRIYRALEIGKVSLEDDGLKLRKNPALMPNE